MPVFVDANCFKGYHDASINGSTDHYIMAFDEIESKTWIALDDEGLFHNEWRSCTGGESNIYAADLIGDLFARDVIRIIQFNRDPAANKYARLHGMPAKDRRVIEFSISSNLSMIVSHDVDLYEPSSKGCNSSRRRKIVQERRGSFCRDIEKKHRIVVCCCESVPDFILDERVQA